MIDILTIDDMLALRKSDPDFLAEVCKELSLVNIFQMLDSFAGKQLGHNQESYDRFVDARRAQGCKTCEGTGVVLPKARSVGTIHPSSANACVLRLYNDVMGIKRPRQELPSGLRVTFDFGHVVHARVQAALLAASNWDTDREIERLGVADWDPWAADARKIGDHLANAEFLFEDEVRVDLPEALVDNGHADGRFYITLNVLGERVRVRGVLEIKTSGEAEFPKVTKPKDDHQIQANGLYANALDCPFIVYIYIGKIFDYERMFTREFVVPFSPEIYSDWCRRKLNPIEEALSTGKPPTADASSYECSKCGYNRDCAQRRGGNAPGRRPRR